MWGKKRCPRICVLLARDIENYNKNLINVLVPMLVPRCTSTRVLLTTYIYIYIYICVCVRVFVHTS